MRSMSTRNILLAASAAALIAAPAHAAPMKLAPSSGWVLDSQDGTCRLIRTFGASNPTTLMIEREGPREMPRLLVTGKALGKVSKRNRVELDFEPIEMAHFETRQASKAGNGDTLLIFDRVGFHKSGKVVAGRRGGQPPVAVWQEDPDMRADLLASENERAAKADRVRVRISSGADVTLETGPLAGPMSLLSSCIDNQLMAMDVDPSAQRDLMRYVRPMVSPRTWLDKFPGLGTKRDTVTFAKVRLRVDENGRATQCEMQSPADGEAFEEKACAHILDISRFVPAKTRDGTAVPTYYVTRLTR